MNRNCVLYLSSRPKRARRSMSTHWAGSTVDDYVGRSMTAMAEAYRAAGECGFRCCRLREALVEFDTFNDECIPGSPALIGAAPLCIDTWRLRKRFDWLWHKKHQFLSTEQEIPGLADTHSEDSFQENETNQAEPASLDLDNAEEQLESGEFLGMRESPDDEPATSNSGSTEMSESRMTATVIEEDDEDDAQEEDLSSEHDLSTEHELAARNGHDQATAWNLQESDIAEGESGSTHSLSGGDCSISQQQRDADLVGASTLLEAFLNRTPEGEFVESIAAVKNDFAVPARHGAGVFLILTYLLRWRPTQKEEVRRRAVCLDNDIVQHLNMASRAKSIDQQLLRELRQLYFDVLYDREDFTHVIGHLKRSRQRTPYESQILADAECGLLRQVHQQAELSDVLRFDAIGHYFEAQDPSLWTHERVADMFEEFASFPDMQRLFDNETVTIAKSTMYFKPAAKTEPRPAAKSASPSKPGKTSTVEAIKLPPKARPKPPAIPIAKPAQATARPAPPPIPARPKPVNTSNDYNLAPPSPPTAKPQPSPTATSNVSVKVLLFDASTQANKGEFMIERWPSYLAIDQHGGLHYSHKRSKKWEPQVILRMDKQQLTGQAFAPSVLIKGKSVTHAESLGRGDKVHLGPIIIEIGEIRPS